MIDVGGVTRMSDKLLNTSSKLAEVKKRKGSISEEDKAGVMESQ
jgi:hypothetical protein